ncbi:intein-containing kinesin family member 19a precursor [Anaeramoeba ignava]|uniref:Intein-containing kinesin family member 19a n=1 Tax=Anaeramoeba ignava TaxID=1746090 RepID=A0A9Q0LXB9_ANAIG|nr:intein-containing kinesin family member 19a precursor [Anaeramoeba ignava]
MSSKNESNSLGVAIRLRPLMGNEKNNPKIVEILNDQIVLFDPPTEKENELNSHSNGHRRGCRDKKFYFDYAAHEHISQMEFYEKTAKKMIEEDGGLFDGFNVTIFAYGATGAGKSLRNNATVYTPSGPKKNGELKAGELICTPFGKTSRIVEVFPQGKLDIYRIHFQNGDFVDCSEDHLWNINDHKFSHKDVLVDTRYIIDNIEPNRFSVSVPDPVQFYHSNVSVDPLLLIFFLLFGSSNDSNISFNFDGKFLFLFEQIYHKNVNQIKNDFQISKLINQENQACTFSLNPRKIHGLQKTAFFQALSQLSLAGKKRQEMFIPSDYLYNSIDIRLSLLKSLLEIFRKKENQIESDFEHKITLKSHQFANDFKTMIQSLGGICRIHRKEEEEKFECVFWISKTLCEEKEGDGGRVVAEANKRKREVVRRIVRVEHVGKDDCQCILIDDPKHLYLTDNFIATHNTYTMMGCRANEKPGIMYLAMKSLYEKIAMKKENCNFKVTVSYLEIYKERIRDLLNPETESSLLDIREDSVKGVTVVNLKEEKPESVDEVMEILNRGNKNRTQSRTEANEVSSRSHAVLQIVVEMAAQKSDGFTTNVKTAKLCLIDLAGSERSSKNKGDRLIEGAKINKSLLSLGNCINALASSKGNGFVPYRDSKLTRLLKDSLGGNCKTLMIANISGSFLHYDDTFNTLVYASRASKIRTTPSCNTSSVTAHISEFMGMINSLRQENTELKEKIRKMESGGDSLQTTQTKNPVIIERDLSKFSNLFSRILQFKKQKEKTKMDILSLQIDSLKNHNLQYNQINQLKLKQSQIKSQIKNTYEQIEEEKSKQEEDLESDPFFSQKLEFLETKNKLDIKNEVLLTHKKQIQECETFRKLFFDQLDSLCSDSQVSKSIQHKINNIKSEWPKISFISKSPKKEKTEQSEQTQFKKIEENFLNSPQVLFGSNKSNRKRLNEYNSNDKENQNPNLISKKNNISSKKFEMKRPKFRLPKKGKNKIQAPMGQLKSYNLKTKGNAISNRNSQPTQKISTKN